MCYFKFITTHVHFNRTRRMSENTESNSTMFYIYCTLFSNCYSCIQVYFWMHDPIVSVLTDYISLMFLFLFDNYEVPSWSWSYGSYIYNYLRNQYLSLLTLLVRIPLRLGVLDTTLCDKVCQWLAAGRWFSQGIPASSTNETDRHDISEILLKVVLNTITMTTPFDNYVIF